MLTAEQMNARAAYFEKCAAANEEDGNARVALSFQVDALALRIAAAAMEWARSAEALHAATPVPCVTVDCCDENCPALPFDRLLQANAEAEGRLAALCEEAMKEDR